MNWLEPVINIVSCIFTVFALVFTLYFWSLDHLSDDETKFMESKRDYISKLRSAAQIIAQPGISHAAICEQAIEVNDILRILVKYRFWIGNAERKKCDEIRHFYEDSRYYISELKRIDEEDSESVVDIGHDDDDERKLLEIVKEQYLDMLGGIVEFLENME